MIIIRTTQMAFRMLKRVVSRHQEAPRKTDTQLQELGSASKNARRFMKKVLGALCKWAPDDC